MADLRKTALYLLVAGLLLLPAPAYSMGLDAATSTDRHRLAGGYQAVPINASNDQALADGYTQRLAFQVTDFEWEFVREDYAAPNRTQAVLERAIENGTASTTAPDVRSDLRAVEGNHTFLTVEWDRFYSFSVATDGDRTTVTATNASVDARATAVRRELVVEYDSLSPAERRTFEKIRNATVSEDQYDYRPWSDEPMPPKPLVRKGDTLYAVRNTSQTDDFDLPVGFFASLVASGVGLVCLLVAGVLGTVHWYRTRGETEA